MRLEKLTLQDFRNYSRQTFCPGPGLNVLVGKNAQGKTNLLESIFLCCTGRSHRTSRDGEMILEGRDVALISCESLRKDGIHEVSVKLSRLGRKEVRINGSTAKRLGELMGHISGVLFSPEDLFLIKQGPAERRRFMDMAISQTRPAYFYALQQYHRVLLHRNKLLKGDERQRKAIVVFDEQLAALGESIMQNRLDFAEKLQESAMAVHLELSARLERLTVAYGPVKTREQLFDALQAALEGDIRRGGTSVGPHRDDLTLRINDKDARAYASQGQQRTAALSLKIAQTRLMEQELGEPPLLMLDDVLSELDKSRQEMLFDCASGLQTIISCTDSTLLPRASRGFFVQDGQVTELEQ